MKVLFFHFKGYYKELTLGPVFKLLETMLELMVPLIMADIIDTGVKHGDVRYIITRGLFMLGLGAVGLCCALLCQYFAAKCAFGFGRSLRRGLFRHVYGLSQTEYGAVGADSLVTRLSNDVTLVQTGVNMTIRLAMRSPILIVGAVAMALTINVKMGLVFVVFAPVILLVLYFIMSRSLPFYTKVQKQQDVIVRRVGESLAGVRVIRAFSRQDSEERQLNEAGDALADTAIRAGRLSALLNPVTSVLVNLAILVILWMGGSFVDGGALQQGQVIALVNYMTQTLLALIVLANLIVTLTKALAGARRVSEVLNLASSMPEVTQSEPEQAGAPCIAFDAVSFRYKDGGEEVLSNISFAVKKGQTLGVIGGTGCGKTTLVRLLLRDYDVTAGSVRVNGVDVRHYTLKDLRARLGVVPQGLLLFRGTVRSNLTMGCAHITDEMLWNALETAQAQDFVRALPQSLDSPVEEGGKNFSGGQKQRLTIARALAAQPEILALDDAASALDYATDAALRKALRETGHARTTILISQRAATVKDADNILVLDDGGAAGFGTHAALLESCEIYREICVSQGVLRAEDASGTSVDANARQKSASQAEQGAGQSSIQSANAEPKPREVRA